MKLWGSNLLNYLVNIYHINLIIEVCTTLLVKKSLCNFSIVNSLIFKNCIKYRQSSGKFSLKFYHFQHFQPKFL